jgi:hypothetical protein
MAPYVKVVASRRINDVQDVEQEDYANNSRKVEAIVKGFINEHRQLR